MTKPNKLVWHHVPAEKSNGNLEQQIDFAKAFVPGGYILRAILNNSISITFVPNLDYSA